MANDGNTTAPSQSGVIGGLIPTDYNPSHPLTLFIIQTIIIIVVCRLLHYPLAYLRQPRVIAEVIGGILLGPSVFMRIPGFQEHIFPSESMPVLNNVANLGLLLFLFLVGLELDFSTFTGNWKAALNVGLASLILPFGLGFGFAWALYYPFGDGDHNPISFSVFGLFIGTALSITAFPVLCRILTELNLLTTIVGMTTLAAGIGNDVIGWVLLALCVTLVNSSSGLEALWVFLVCVGWILFVFLAVRPALVWFLRRSGSLQNGPTQGAVTITLLLMLASAFFTDIIGVHAIFGAFIIGLICPHDGGFAIKFTEKIEDLVGILFLPLYFTLSGLRTNLGLLSDGETWGYVIATICIALFAKIIGATLAARFSNMLWRESLAVGALMSCKGLVELIVLNIGLNAGIISDKTFTMFVVMAVVTTVATSPLTQWIYPPSYQDKVERWRRGEIDWDGNPILTDETDHSGSHDGKFKTLHIRRILVQIHMDTLPELFAFIALLGGQRPRVEDRQQKATYALERTETASTVVTINTAKKKRDSKPPTGDTRDDAKEDDVQSATPFPVYQSPPKRPLEVYGLRLMELTERTSSVMQMAAEERNLMDPILNVFTTFVHLQACAAAARLAVVPRGSYVETIAQQASDIRSDLVLVPWGGSHTGLDESSYPTGRGSHAMQGPVAMDCEFIEDVFRNAATNVCVLVHQARSKEPISSAATAESRPKMPRAVSMRSSHSLRDVPLVSTSSSRGTRIFLPFFGGPDDHVALGLALQMSGNPKVHTTIVYFQHQRSPESITSGPKTAVTVTTEETPVSEDQAILAAAKASLSPSFLERVVFEDAFYSTLWSLDTVVEAARMRLGKSWSNGDNFIVVGRTHVVDMKGADGQAEGQESELQRAVGELGAKFMASGIEGSVLVTQAVS